MDIAGNKEIKNQNIKMKNMYIKLREIAIIFLSICYCVSFAQDTIITKENKSIKAKIVEVTPEKVSYKKYDYQEGATIVLELSKVKTIVWGNGDIEHFDVEEPKEKAVKPEKIGDNDNTKLNPIIDKNANGVYFSDENHMSHDEFQKYLHTNNMDYIWNKYSDGIYQKEIGIGLLIAGLSLEIIGICIVSSDGIDNKSALTAGSVIIAVGGVLEIASIPTMIIGGTKRAKAIDTYNESLQVRYSYLPTLKIGFTGNGVGVVFNF
jgi:hypothetical protein